MDSMRREPALRRCAVWGIRALRACVRVDGLEEPVLPLQGPVVLAGWHGEQLALLMAFQSVPMRVLVSRSRDGDFATAVLDELGVETIRGSTSSGAVAALRAGARHLRGGGRVAILVDGPRGPRHCAAPGAAALASMVGCPILCVRASSSPGLRLRTWDKFEIPLPGARIRIATQLLSAPTRETGAVEETTRQLERALLGVLPE